VILSIDSLGGYVAEKERIVEVIRQARDVRFIAHVKRAVSAAAVVALACPEIYVADDATIGATVTVMTVARGQVQAVDEKIQSVVRASDRAVATGAGHSDLWIRGMSERDLELSVRRDRDGVTRIMEATGDPSEQVIKRRGQILTLNGREAVSYGLAKAACPTLASIKDQLKLPAWHAVDDAPWHSMVNHGKTARAEHERLLRIGPAVREFQTKLGQTTAKVLAIEAALGELKRQRDTDLDRLREQYDQKMQAASRSVAEQARVERMYKAAQKRIADYYDNQITQGEQEFDRARKELARAKEEFDALVGAGD
jgi:membrane-bound serine protease (ClpP class)